MTGFKSIAAALILTAGMATPVFAQAAIGEPGAYAFYHPNSDLGLGSPWPAPDARAAMAMAMPAATMRHGKRSMSHHAAMMHGHAKHANVKRGDRYGMK